MFRVGLYARVSTQDQQTIPLQMRAMREYAATRGWTIVMQVKEVGSGASERELRQKLIEAARRREIDVVLVWRLDRWGRSLPDLVTTLEELNHLGVGFVSLTEALDLTTPTGRAMAGLLCVFAAVRTRNPAGACTRRPRPRPAEWAATRPSCHGCCQISRNPQTASRRRQQGRDRTSAQHRPHLCSPHSGCSAMKKPRKDPVRENRIHEEAIVDAYGPEEKAMSWYYYLEGKLSFPFRARCTASKITSPLKKGEDVEVVRMAPDEACATDMLVLVRWQGRKLAVPLAQLTAIDPDESTAEAIGDWHYWVAQGYLF